MSNATGIKHGGRQKGTPNRLTKELRLILNGIDKDEINSFSVDILYDKWTFFEEITTLPTVEVGGITSSEFASVRLNYLYLNNGTNALPSLTFNTDTDTGFYLESADNIGVSAGSNNIFNIFIIMHFEKFFVTFLKFIIRICI